MFRTPTLTVADLASAAMWLAKYGTDELDGWLSDQWDRGHYTGDEADEWQRCYGDLARELAGNIERLVEVEADRMVSAEIRKAVTK